jgi:uncharacterized protein YndB with AHSA1/START domain
MNKPTKPAALIGDREIVATRIFNAPRELVWKMWTDPQHVAKWWGQNGFTNTIHEMNVKPGGVWRFVMRGPDGREYSNRIVYLEVVEPERLVYAHGGDEFGNNAHFQVTVSFVEQGSKTKLTTLMAFPSTAAREHGIRKYGALEGQTQNLDRLQNYLAKM